MIKSFLIYTFPDNITHVEAVRGDMRIDSNGQPAGFNTLSEIKNNGFWGVVLNDEKLIKGISDAAAIDFPRDSDEYWLKHEVFPIIQDLIKRDDAGTL